MGFSEELRTAADDVWQAHHEHPFVRGIGDGSLEPSRFSFFVRQDYLFLVEYARLLALGAARAHDLATMRRFAELSSAVLNGEMELHRGFAAELGISTEALEGEEMAPTTRAYTDFLVRTAATGEVAELVAALLPCMWGYHEIGLRLAERGRPANEHYTRWIDEYASEAFGELAAWCRELTEHVAADVGVDGRSRMHVAFRTSSRYEWSFWQMAWDQERWQP